MDSKAPSRKQDDEPVELARARDQGWRYAHGVDAHLREIERQERRLRFDGPRGASAAIVDETLEDESLGEKVARLRDQLERLTTYKNKVINSRAWRAVQLARRPFGREWPDAD